MPGSKRVGVVLQDRDRHLLSELAVLRVADRETAAVVAGFAALRRVNRRLLKLTRAGLLRRFFVGSAAHGRKAIYTLSPQGAELVHSELGGIQRPANRLVVSDAFVGHQAAINQIYLAVKYKPAQGVALGRWLTFRQSISEAIKLTPDAYMEIAAKDVMRPMFLEVDLGTEALSVWQQKTAYYVQLAITGEFQRRFHQPQFRVLVVANTERRMANVRATVLKSTDKIFWFATLETINREGIWSPLWLRPSGDQRQSLF